MADNDKTEEQLAIDEATRIVRDARAKSLAVPQAEKVSVKFSGDTADAADDWLRKIQRENEANQRILEQSDLTPEALERLITKSRSLFELVKKHPAPYLTKNSLTIVTGQIDSISGPLGKLLNPEDFLMGMNPSIQMIYGEKHFQTKFREGISRVTDDPLPFELYISIHTDKITEEEIQRLIQANPEVAKGIGTIYFYGPSGLYKLVALPEVIRDPRPILLHDSYNSQKPRYVLGEVTVDDVKLLGYIISRIKEDILSKTY